MYNRILKRAHACIRESNYYMTRHAQLKMYKQDLILAEVERAILKGRIIERQKNTKSSEFKYRIRGIIPGGEIEAIFKFAPDERLAIITVYTL